MQEHPQEKAQNSLRMCVIRALKCSMAVRLYEAHGLTSHCGLSCGEMKFATLGGFLGNWAYLLNGDCVTELNGCLSAAASKEVVMTPACNELMRSALGLHVASFASTETDGGNFKLADLSFIINFAPPGSRIKDLPTSSAMTYLISCFIPKIVVEAINTGSFNAMSELRAVTTLFLSLDSYSSELHLDPISLQPFFLLAQSAIHSSGGFQRQFIIDDKGCVLIIMWGVPSYSYSNNVSRAIDCAVDIYRATTAIGHKVSIGITTGSVFCGSIGSVVRRDYVGIGDTVNTAARLMSKARGRILMGMYCICMSICV